MTSGWRLRLPCASRGRNAGPFGPAAYWLVWHASRLRRSEPRQKLLGWLEDNILIRELKAPAYSLGTATSHPWLRDMYLKLGFQPVFERDLGKGHITLYLKKFSMKKATPAGWNVSHLQEFKC